MILFRSLSNSTMFHLNENFDCDHVMEYELGPDIQMASFPGSVTVITLPWFLAHSQILTWIINSCNENEKHLPRILSNILYRYCCLALVFVTQLIIKLSYKNNFKRAEKDLREITTRTAKWTFLMTSWWRLKLNSADCQVSVTLLHSYDAEFKSFDSALTII